MSTHNSGISAILIFANSAQEELRHKPSVRNKNLFDALTRQTLKVVQSTGLPYFHVSEKDQVGTSFGERFTRAIQGVFDKGYGQVITIGNDSPHLTGTHLLHAVGELQNNKAVLGPSKDGGFYLMGIKKAHFKAQAFQELPWQSSKLYGALTLLFRSTATKVGVLNPLQDIDEVADLRYVLSQFQEIATSVKAVIVSLLKKRYVGDRQTIHTYFTSKPSPFYNKGSPVLL